MKHLKQHPLTEKSYLSDMADMNLDPDATIVAQERPDSGNEFQKLSQASKGKNDTESTYKMNKSELNQKLSKASALEIEPSKDAPKVDSSYQKLSGDAEEVNTDAEEVVKISKREEDGNAFQRLSDKPEVDKPSSTYKQNDSELDQKLSTIAEKKIISFENFKK
jgi:hypothetical protein